MDVEAGDRDRIESHLREAIDSDHPDLAPRAALRLAQMKRTTGQFIDAYKFARLVVGSEHPIFAAEGEVECQRLLRGELDSLLELEAPTPDQLALPSMVERTGRAVNLYFPITSRGRHPECDGISGPKGDERSSIWRHNLSLLGQAELWSPRTDPCEVEDAVGAAPLLTALVGGIDGDKLSDLQSVRYATRVVEGHGCGYRGATLPASWSHHRTTSPCDHRDLEFLLLLRATGWLRDESSSLEPRVPVQRLELFFERTTERLADLLAVDRRPFRDREAIWLMGILDGQGSGGVFEGVSRPPLLGASGSGRVEALGTAREAGSIEGTATAVTA
jgi:hypothetical protein